jgi:hypothetical protein
MTKQSVGRVTEAQHFILASLLTMSVYLVQGVRVAQRLFAPRTYAPGNLHYLQTQMCLQKGITSGCPVSGTCIKATGG